MDGIINDIYKCVRNKIDLSRELSDEEIIDIIDSVIIEKSRTIIISTSDKVKIAKQLFNSLRKLDILQPLIEDDTITEIMVNGTEKIFVEKEGHIIQIDVQFQSLEKLEDIIQRIVSKINRVVNESSPICDARLEDGSRVSIILPPIALNGPILTIRKFSDKVISMENLIQWNSITKEVALFLKNAVTAKYNIFIAGGTGSGKTTFLNILSNYISKDERIITIEDSAELRLSNVKNLVSLETRNANVEGKGKIDIRDLIKSSLRMRPDRIIVGEVRGYEAIDMLQAMNTGHDGSLSTGHANSTKDMLSRLETMILSGDNMPIEAIRQQIASSIDLIIFIGRMRDKTRKVLEVVELAGCENNHIILNPLYTFKESNESQKDIVIGSLVATNNPLINQKKFIAAGIKFK